ncbi:hypothetical protein SE17_34365, partial [Kouleothrix aurantiaca]
GYERIAVVCGAWHAPALVDLASPKADAALLKGLPKTKLQATWVPWTHGRLAYGSGYGAGIESPGWYEHLWHGMRAGHTSTEVATRWLARVARLLREQDFDVSSAHVIEAVRLAEALAALRGRDFVRPDDVKELAVPVLAHRLILAPEARLRGRSPAEVVRNAVVKVPAPVE